MDIYKIYNDAETLELEAFTNFSLSEKKVKGKTWFQNEPQILKFTVYSFGNNPGNEDWQDTATNFYTILLNMINFSENSSYGGMSYYDKIKLKLNDSTIFTGYVDLTSSEIDEENGRADFVCYDSLKILSLLDNYIPYGSYSLGEFLNNSFYSFSSILSQYDWSVKNALDRMGFDDINISFSGSTIAESTENYINENTTEYFWRTLSPDKGFYLYQDTLGDRIINHLFFVYFEVYINLVGNINKNIGIFEIVNGYCPIDKIYNLKDEVIIYDSEEEAEADLQNQIDEEIANINSLISVWGDSWFSLTNILDTISINGYDYEFINSTNILNRKIKVTGNIFPAKVFFGDNEKYFSPITSFFDQIESDVKWIDGLKSFLVGNNLLLKATETGNIEIKSVIQTNPIAIDNNFISKNISFILNSESTKTNISGNTEAIDNNLESYYSNYLKSLKYYKIKFWKDEQLLEITRNITVLKTIQYNSINYLILRIKETDSVFETECIEV